MPAAGAAEVNEVEEATAVDLNKEDASSNVVVLQEFTHAAADLKDKASGSAIIKSKVHASGADEVKLEDTASAVLKEVSHPAAEKVNSEDLSENGDTATKLPDVSKSPEQETAHNDEASKTTIVFQEAAGSTIVMLLVL